jgi:hypothetical protein
LPHPAVYRAAAKADAILPAIIIVALAKIACIGAATTPIPDMQLASTLSTAEESYQKTLASAYRRHRLVSLPVHRITPHHSSVPRADRIAEGCAARSEVASSAGALLTFENLGEGIADLVSDLCRQAIPQFEGAGMLGSALSFRTHRVSSGTDGSNPSPSSGESGTNCSVKHAISSERTQANRAATRASRWIKFATNNNKMRMRPAASQSMVYFP